MKISLWLKFSLLFTGVLLWAGCRHVPAPSGADYENNLRVRSARLHRSALVIDGHNDALCAVLDWRFDLNGCGAPAYGAVYDYSGRRTRPADGKIYTETDLPRLREGGVSAQFFSIYPRRTFIDRKIADGGGAAHRTLDLIDALHRQIQTHPDQMALARTADEVRRITREGKLAALLGIDGGHAIENRRN